MRQPVVFGKYLLLERLNVGGMAEVFIAKAFGVEGFERILAIKKILPTMAEDAEFISMFIDEARISVQLNHANVVQIHELGKHEQSYFIAMEYVAGKDLRTLLERHRRRGEKIDPHQAAYIASKLCEGLDYAHRKRDPRGDHLHIIHRDVSPQNVLISYDGDVKIIDFGIAKAANRSQKTQAGILKGKFGYMSPEQVRGLSIDRRSDIFAVGVILHEMLAGEKLFVGESDFSTLEKVRNAEIPSLRSENPNIPAELEEVVMRALAREPEDRYQWASDLQEDLMRFLLSKDEFYSAKTLSNYMHSDFAEDFMREEERMRRFSGISRPGEIELTGVTTRAPGRTTSDSQHDDQSLSATVSGKRSEQDGAIEDVRSDTQIVPNKSADVSEDSLALSAASGARASMSMVAGRSQVVIGSPAGISAGETVIKPKPEAPSQSSQPSQPSPHSASLSQPPSDSAPPNSQAQTQSSEPSMSALSEPPVSKGGASHPGARAGSTDATMMLSGDDVSKSKPSTVNGQGQENASKTERPVTVETTPKPWGDPSKIWEKKSVQFGAAAAAVMLLVAIASNFFIERPLAYATITTVPENAVVMIMGKVVDASAAVPFYEKGRYIITAAAEGYFSEQQEVDVQKGEDVTIDFVLKPDGVPEQPMVAAVVVDAGSEKLVKATDTLNTAKADAAVKTYELKIKSKPARGVSIYIDGDLMGKTPNVTVENLEYGQTYEITAKRRRYQPFTATLKRHESDGDEPFVVKMSRKKRPTRSKSAKGQLLATTRPTGAEIYINGSSTGRRTPVLKSKPLYLPVGPHTVVFKLGGQSSKPIQIRIAQNKQRLLRDVELN